MVGTLVTVATFDNVLEAGYWQGLVESHGIPVVLIDKEIVAAVWWISRAVGNIKLQVPEAEARRANGILESIRKEHPYRGPEGPEGPEARRALKAGFLGLMFPPLQLYSLWLLARLLPRWRQLLPRDRRRMKLAAPLDLWLPVVVFAYCSIPW